MWTQRVPAKKLPKLLFFVCQQKPQFSNSNRDESHRNSQALLIPSPVGGEEPVCLFQETCRDGKLALAQPALINFPGAGGWAQATLGGGAELLASFASQKRLLKGSSF